MPNIKRQVIPVKHHVGDIVSLGEVLRPIINVTLQNKIPLYDLGGGLRLMENEIHYNCNPQAYAAAVAKHTAEFPDE